MLTFMPMPTTAGARSWTQFSEARGEGFNVFGSALTGGRTGTGQEPPAWNTQAAVKSALPLLAAAALLAIWFIG